MPAGAVEKNTPDRWPQTYAELAATPGANGVAADTGGQDLIEEQPD
jgi:hypothetical protein